MATRGGVVLSDEEAWLVCEAVGEARGRLHPDDRPRLSREQQAVLATLSQAAADWRLRERLVPVAVAARLTGVPERTWRDRASRGLCAAVRDGKRWLVDFSP